MVVTCLPWTCDSAVWHERVALPSMCTVQAPHRPEPQPNLVPVSFRCSRSTHSGGVSGSAVTLTAVPLTVNPIAMRSLLGEQFVSCRQPRGRGDVSMIQNAMLTEPSPPRYCPVWRHYRHGRSPLA